MIRGGFQPYQSGASRPQGMTLAAMLAGRPLGLMHPMDPRRNTQALVRLLLTGQRPDN